MIGWVLGAGAVGGTVWLLTRKRSSRSKSSSGSMAYSNGWIGEWRLLKLPTGWMGQFRIHPEGFGDGDTGWLNVPQGLAQTSAQARLLALEQLALNDPTSTQNQIVDSGNMLKDGKVYHWSVIRLIDTGLYRPMVAVVPDGVLPKDSDWSAVADDRLKPAEARNLALEWIANH